MAYFIRKFTPSFSDTQDTRDSNTVVIYSDLKNLAFAPEYDITLATLPICEFTVDVVTTQPPTTFVGAFVDLCEDRDTTKQQKIVLAGYYRVTEATRLNAEVISIHAQSMLAWLDTRIMSHYTPTESIKTVAQLIEGIFRNVPLNKDSDYFDQFSYLPYVLKTTMNWQVMGVCPEQTARERLAWLSQAYGLVIQQWGDESKSGLIISQVSSALSLQTREGTLIPYEQVFLRPTITDVEPALSFDVTQYNNFTETEQSGDTWDKMTLRSPYHYPGEEETGLVDPGVTVYFQYYTTRTVNGNVDDGDTVQLDHNYLITQRSAANMIDYLPYPLFDCDCEIDADILQVKKALNDEYFWPGDIVRLHVNADTVYQGIIIASTFVFGAQARSHIVVRAIRQSVTMQTLTVNFKYLDYVLGQRVYHYTYYRHGFAYTITCPTFTLYDGDVVYTFTPQTASYSGTLTGDDVTINAEYDLS